MTLGPMEAVAESIAQTNRELAGFGQTRLTLAVSVGDVFFPVESTYDWPTSGSIVVFGQIYTYSGKNLTTLDGIEWTDGETVFTGARVNLEARTIVTDVSKASSATDLLRRAMLVDTADGEDLNTVGRNIGVYRQPFLRNDERFRELIKALGYNPRGTVYGLELVLTALVGAGNFEIFEDVISYPNQVFFRLINDAATDDFAAGKAYWRGEEYRPSDSASQVTVNESIVSRGHVTSVQLKDENHLTDCRAAYPSADSITEYVGDPGTTVWALFGTGLTEGVHITLLTGVNPTLSFATAPPTDRSLYEHALRITVNAAVRGSILCTVPTGAAGASPGTGLAIDDGAYVGWAGVRTDTASTFRLGFTDGTAFISGYVVLNRDQFYEIEIRKGYGAVDWELWVDGVLVQTTAYTTTASTTPRMTFGHFVLATAVVPFYVKHASFWSHEPTDYWGINTTDGVMINPDILTSATGAFLSGDVGKQLITADNTGSNEINNGEWIIYQRDSATQVRVRGKWWPGRADLGVDATDRIVVDETNPQLFTYPDDVGKSIEIQNSTEGNDGVYVIASLLEPGTLTDFSTYDTPVIEKTNIAVITGALSPENDAEWRLLPAFAATATDWEMPEAGSEASSVLTLRSPSVLPHPVVVSAMYSKVLGANILYDAQIINTILQADPLILEYNPLYLTDPIGFLRAYLDDVTAAGVIPSYEY